VLILPQNWTTENAMAGTITAGTGGNPKRVRRGAAKEMKSEGSCAYRNNSALITGWKDKTVMFMMSTYHHIQMENVVTDHKGGNRKKFKSQCVYLTTQNK
jgi:hypothetical protein